MNPLTPRVPGAPAVQLIEVRVSCPDEETAVALGRAAVEARLAASANVTAIRSVYRWQRETHEAGEWSLSLKTRADLFDPVRRLIRKGHPFELPAVMAHPCHADDDTTRWIAEATDLSSGP